MNKLVNNTMNVVRKYDIRGIIFTLIFCYFQHDVALYEWISEQYDEHLAEEVDENVPWVPFM